MAMSLSIWKSAEEKLATLQKYYNLQFFFLLRGLINYNKDSGL